MHRLFVAFRPPAHIRDLLIDAIDDSPELRWVPDDNLHLTLRFIGEVERPVAEDIAAALDQIRSPSFTIVLAGIGQFAQRNRGSVWVGVQPRKPLAALAAKIERACVDAGLTPEHRAFHPHITLARWSRSPAEVVESFLRRNADLASSPFPVEQFTLFESHLSRHGPHYEPVVEYKLRG